MKKVGVLLAGAGHLDGAEIREAVLTLLSLDRINEKYPFDIIMMAPNRNQYHVMNHLSRTEVQETRNILVEAARIARGNIQDLSQINPRDLDALIMPGGFGAAKNFSNFVLTGSKGTLDQEIASLITHMHDHKKPIGGICISPALISLALGKRGVTVTLGENNDTIQEVLLTGAKHQNCSVSEICIDRPNRLVTTPAYMHGNAKTHQVAEGIDKCVSQVIKLMLEID